MGRPTATVQRARQVLALRRATRHGDEVRADLEPVIDEIRAEVGETLSKRQAAQIIGVSVPTLDKWIARGLLPVQLAASGRPRLGRDVVIDLAERVEAVRNTGQQHQLIASVVNEMLRSDDRYQREFEEMYGPGLAAMRKGDFVSAEPGADWHPED